MMAINFSMTKKVAVVILGWNGKKFLEQFLPSVVQHTPQDWCEIVVADNASTDGSIEFVQENYPQITIIQNGRNGGYAGGYNDALAKVKADYYVLLNQDIEVTEGWIARIVDVMDGDRKIAAAQPKLLDYFKRNKFEYAGASGGFIDAFGYAFCRGRVFDTIEEDNGQYDDVVPVFWATGACLVVRADAYWQAGGLDEDFFAHQEEIDLCWRMQNLGYKIVVVPGSVVYHVGGGSLPYGNTRKTYLNFRNNLMLLFKNLPFGELMWKLPIRLFLDIVAAHQALLIEKNMTTFKAIVRAHVDFVKQLPSLLVKRKLIPNKRKNLLLRMSVVKQYFLDARQTYSALHR